MADLTIPIPNNYQRLDNRPLDPTSTFDTYSGMTEYLSNGTRYPGQVVTCNEKEGSIFVLNSGGIDWIEYKNSGSELIISKTYNELSLMVSGGTLIPEQKYLLSDYQTKHLICFTSVINTGPIEPLILIASSSNSFYLECKSTIYPTDILKYDFNDNFCEDGTYDEINNNYSINATPRNGFIIYRETINRFSVEYDFRVTKARRWKIDAEEWISGKLYLDGDIIKSSVTGDLYISKLNNSGTTEPSITNNINWCSFMNLDIQTTGNAYLFQYPSTIYSGLPYNFTYVFVDENTYKDYYLITDAFDGTNYCDSIIDCEFTFSDKYNYYITNINPNANPYLYFTTVVFYNQGVNFCNFNNIGHNNTINARTIYGNDFYGLNDTIITSDSIGFGKINKLTLNTCVINCGGSIGSNNIYINSSIVGGSGGMYYNIGEIYGSIIGSPFVGNNNFIISNSRLRDNFIYNNCEYSSGNTIDNIYLSGATHIYLNYPKTLTKNSSGVSRLVYLNASNVLTNVAITS